MKPSSSDPELVRTTEDLEAQAWADCYAAAAARGLPARVHACGGAVQLLTPGSRSPMLNRVIGLSARPPAEVVLAVLNTFSAHGVARFLLHLRPGSPSPELEATLAAHGVGRYRRDWVTLVRGPAPAMEVEAAATIDDATEADRPAVARVLGQGFGLTPAESTILAAVVERPGWTTLVARDAGRVVAAGLMYARESVAYLAGCATAPTHRGRGIQTALLQHRIRIGLAAGVRRFQSETGAPGPGGTRTSHDNMRRAGFWPAYVRRNYAPRDMSWDHGRSSATAS